jgi:hypothetical protein
MPTSIFLAKPIGNVPLAVGLLANGTAYRKLGYEFLLIRARFWLSAVISMAAGLVVLLPQHVWTVDRSLLVTLLGWPVRVGGTLRLTAPQDLQAIGQWFAGRPAAFTPGGAVWPTVGAVLGFFGHAR